MGDIIFDFIRITGASEEEVTYSFKKPVVGVLVSYNF